LNATSTLLFRTRMWEAVVQGVSTF